jgi:hypothetical protein
MNIIHTTHPHEHHHVVPLVIAGTTAVVAAALLTGPVDLSFGGDDSPSTTPQVKHLSVVSAAASVGLCTSSATRRLPSDVPPPPCGHLLVHARHSADANAPVPCFRQFRVWPGDVARPAGCD